MSDGRPLAYNKLYNAKSKDGTTSLSISVYENIASINVFMNSDDARKPAAKFNLPPDGITKLIYIARKCLNAAPESKFSISTNRYDPEAKKAIPTGDITMGRDASRTPFIAINAEGISPQVYYMRSSLGWEMASPDADENNVIALYAFIDVLDKDVRIAKLNTSFKKPSTSGAGRSNQAQQGGGYSNAGQQKVHADEIPF